MSCIGENERRLWKRMIGGGVFVALTGAVLFFGFGIWPGLSLFTAGIIFAAVLAHELRWDDRRP